jgi:uncharacterized repeat protein (TIGR03803 family)
MIRGLALGVLVALAASASVQASTLETLYKFCKAQCTDGSGPVANLLSDGNGTYYGVTRNGGEDSGTVYSLSPGKNGNFKQSVLYNFCTNQGCYAGYSPASSLIMDTAGNIYGTTYFGDNSHGAAFELVRGKHKNKWKMQVLYIFCSGVPEHCPDGGGPASNLTYAGAMAGQPYDGTSPLYGTTNTGGDSDKGTLFELTPGKGSWTHTILYSFCAQANCADGAAPSGTLTADAASNIYGTTQQSDAGGVVFEFSGARHHRRAVTETVLHDFCQNGCLDGQGPASLIFDPQGNMFGVTTNEGPSGGGTVFKLVPNGTNSTLATLYAFCSLDLCEDGSSPSSVTIDQSGNLFGGTLSGGITSGGTLFELQPSQGGGYNFAQIYNFCKKRKCPAGAEPSVSLFLEPSGSLIGTTYGGGYTTDGGTVFEFTP